MHPHLRISGSEWPIVLKFDVWLETQKLRDLQESEVGWPHSHVRVQFRCLGNRWALALKPHQKQTYLFRARSFIAKHGVLLVISNTERCWYVDICDRGAFWKYRTSAASEVFLKSAEITNIYIHSRVRYDLYHTSKCMHGMNQTEAEYSRHGKRSQRASLSQISPVVLEV